MKVEIYSKESCHYCQLAKKFLELRKHPFTEHKIGVDLTVDEVREMFPEAKTVPIILMNGKNIGGYVDMVNHFSEAESVN